MELSLCSLPYLAGCNLTEADPAMRIVSLLITLVVAAVLYVIVFQRDLLTGAPDTTEVSVTTEDQRPPAERDTRSLRTVSVVAVHSRASRLDDVVVLRGETEALRSVNVTAETSGRVVNEPLRKGAFVKTGQTLCQLDRGTRDSSLAQAKAAETQAEVALANARKLAAGGYASETQVLSAEANIESARASVAQVERDIENLIIPAPFSGLLESDTAELGTYLTPGTPCATVIQLDPIKLVGFASETDVDKIAVGAPAGGRLLSGKEVTGTVTFLSRSSDPTTRTFRVEVEIPNTDATIRDGQTAEIAIASEGVMAHLVAQSALTLNDDGQIGLRLVGPDNMVSFAPVTVLRDTRDGIWVTGLPDSVDIITVGQDFVRAGVPVDPHFDTESTGSGDTASETPEDSQ